MGVAGQDQIKGMRARAVLVFPLRAMGDQNGVDGRADRTLRRLQLGAVNLLLPQGVFHPAETERLPADGKKHAFSGKQTCAGGCGGLLDQFRPAGFDLMVAGRIEGREGIGEQPQRFRGRLLRDALVKRVSAEQHQIRRKALNGCEELLLLFPVCFAVQIRKKSDPNLGFQLLSGRQRVVRRLYIRLSKEPHGLFLLADDQHDRYRDQCNRHYAENAEDDDEQGA